FRGPATTHGRCHPRTSEEAHSPHVGLSRPRCPPSSVPVLAADSKNVKIAVGVPHPALARGARSMRFVWLTVLTSLFVAAAAVPAPPRERPKEELADKVRVAIKRGVQFLKDREVRHTDGSSSWEVDVNAAPWEGGWTSLAM